MSQFLGYSISGLKETYTLIKARMMPNAEKQKLFYFSKFGLREKNRKSMEMGKNATSCCKMGHLFSSF